MSNDPPPGRSDPRQAAQEKAAEQARTAQLTSTSALVVSIHQRVKRMLSSLDEVEQAVSGVAEDFDELPIHVQNLIQFLQEKTRKLSEYVHKTEQMLQVTVKVQKPELSLVQFDLVYRLLETERDAQILLAFTTLFLGLFLGSIFSPGRVPSSAIGGLTQMEILEFLITIIFSGLAVRAFVQSREKKEDMEKNIKEISFVPKMED